MGKLREVLREMRLLLGIVIILALSVPWYALVIWRNGWNYINAFFGYHNLERFTEVVNGHSAPWYFYFLVVLLGFAPYSVYLPASIGEAEVLAAIALAQPRTFSAIRFICLVSGFWVSLAFSPLLSPNSPATFYL